MIPTPGTPTDTFRSPNFQFLAVHHQLLVRTAAQAERYLFEDPSTSLNILRRFAEMLADQACAYLGLAARPEDDFVRVLSQLRDSRNVPRDILDRFHDIRRAGNAAVHEGRGTQGDALHHLRMARELAIWFHRSFGNASNFTPGPFLPPPNPAQASLELQQELDRLRQQAAEQQQQVEQVQLTATQEAELRRQAEERAQTAYADLSAALSLAEETENRLAQEREQFLQRLAQLQAEVAARPAEQIQAVADRARRAATFMELDEPATRRIIDQQLRDAGWEADSVALTHRNGARPRKGCNRAIAEWPVAGGVADYVLFAGLTPVATVEAKRANRNVPAAVEQARRYARAYTPDGTEEMPGGPWGDYRIPFCLATNGCPYLRQLEDNSGIWFMDARRSTNLPRALEGWYTPDGFLQLLQQDTAAADSQLRQESPDYLPLREYQFQAIRAVESGLAEGRRQMLLAMATGSGQGRSPST